MKKAIAVRRILFAVVAALAVVLGSTAAAVASTVRPADANDVVSIAPIGDQDNSQGETLSNGGYEGAVMVEAESSEGNPITDGTATGLPPGLSIVPYLGDPGNWYFSGTISDTAPPGNYTVTVTTTNSVGTQGTATFTWTIMDPVAVTNPGSQSSRLGAAVSLQISNSGYNSTATGLPPGLTINEYTGLISGTLTRG